MDITVQSFGNDTLAFELTYVLIKANINLNAVDPEKLNDICSQYDHLKDICFPDFSNNDVALVIGTTILTSSAQRPASKEIKMFLEQSLQP